MDSFDNPRIIIGLILVVSLTYGGWVFYENSQSQDPDWQVDKTQSRNFPPHRVNLWSEPSPPEPGKVTFVVEYDFVNLMNKKVDEVRYILEKTGEPTEQIGSTTAEYADSGQYRERYYGSIEVPEPGNWNLTVEGDLENKTSTSTFELMIK